MNKVLHRLPAGLAELIYRYLDQRRSPTTPFTVQRLGGDGSSRIYYRVSAFPAPSFIAVDAAAQAAPRLSCPTAASLTPAADQNQSFHLIRGHLERLGFAVPAGFDRSRDGEYYLLQDLGDNTVFSLLQSQGWNDNSRRLYEDITLLLVRLQTEAAVGFAPEFCFDGAFYDRELIRNREICYFQREFVAGLLGLESEAAALETEFQLLLDQADDDSRFFLYRDFQSRNLMLRDQRIYLIDFQGARFGPGYYDLASLLNDSYAPMPGAFKEHLIRFYYEALGRRVKLLAWPDFYDQFLLFALFRVLQNLGAFAFLSRQGKKQFLDYIPAALSTLRRLLGGLGGRRRLPALENLTAACCRQAASRGLAPASAP